MNPFGPAPSFDEDELINDYVSNAPDFEQQQNSNTKQNTTNTATATKEMTKTNVEPSPISCSNNNIDMNSNTISASTSSAVKREVSLTPNSNNIASQEASGAEVIIDVMDDDEEEEEEANFTLVGSGEYLIVGIRYYNGVAHPGEFVKLVREPHNPYDRNAIRVDNMHGDKIGHVKGTMARHLAPVMDAAHIYNVSIEGTIPRPGNAFNLPLFLEFYSTAPTQELTQKVAQTLHSNLKYAGFYLSREFVLPSNNRAPAAAPAVVVSRKKLDWDAQQKALDEMFDKQLEEQYRDLPDVSMPTDLLNGTIELFDYQVQGIKWLLKKEQTAKPAPFYKTVNENGKTVHLCEITNSSQPCPPKPIKGSILCDSMGLGKSIQTLGLILLAPPRGVEYKVKELSSVTVDEKPMPEDSVIRAATASTLKEILKAAKLKVSGKKDVLIQRILDGKVSKEVTGEHFPVSMRPVANGSTTARCTLIVCPVSVMSNWTDQINTHVKDSVLSLQIYHGPNRRDVLPDVKAGAVDVLLVSYNTLAADFGDVFINNNDGISEPLKKKSKRETIFDIQFHRIVLDEAHTIRNSKTKYFKAVKEINADRKLALTGTPFVNRADDVHSLLSFLGVEPLDNKSVFTRAISQCIKNGDEIGLTRLRTCMGFVSLRRSKQNVNIKLVEKEVQLCSVEFADDSHKRVYDALFGTLRVAMEAILGDEATNGSYALKNYSTIFEKIMRLRQSCCSGVLVPRERREIALKMWDEINDIANSDKKNHRKLTAEEGLALLEKLKGAFTAAEGESNTSNSSTPGLPECGICLTEMEEADGIILKNCSHVFCKLCIKQVLSKSINKKCPYCRIDFNDGDIIDMSTAQSAVNCKSSSVEENDDNDDNASSDDFGVPPKIRALLDGIQSMQPDEKGVIFSQFTKYLNLIGDALKEAGHSFVRIDGSVPAQKRISYIQEFNSDGAETPRFILCSLLASGTGINLTRGNYAFMMDCWWNEAIESQAMDRIHRINQTRKVTIQRFVMKDSIEERIVELQEAKSMQAKGVLQKLKGDEKRKALLGDLRGLLQIE